MNSGALVLRTAEKGFTLASEGGVSRLTQAVVPRMQPRGAGASVQVAARPGVEPTVRVAAYGVSKAALVHLTRLLGVELRENGGRVGAATPGQRSDRANLRRVTRSPRRQHDTTELPGH